MKGEKMRLLILLIDNYSLNKIKIDNKQTCGYQVEIIRVTQTNTRTSIDIDNECNSLVIRLENNGNNYDEKRYNNNQYKHVIILFDHANSCHSSDERQRIWIGSIFNNNADITEHICNSTINQRYNICGNISGSKIQQLLPNLVGYIERDDCENLNLMLGFN
jgi:hypothetical protein